MQFRVVGAASIDTSTPPDQLVLPAPPSLGAAAITRQVSFNEYDSDVLPNVGPRIGLLGQVDLSNPAAPIGVPKRWMDPPTESPTKGTTEIWEIFDFTEDGHPFHIHQVEFEVHGLRHHHRIETIEPWKMAAATPAAAPAPSRR